jgi:hypothetical protein
VFVPGMPGLVSAQVVPSIPVGGEATVSEAEPKEKAAV